jgi:hypothetical protein
VAGEINVGRGSKRKVGLIRWKRSEKLSMVLLFLVVVIDRIYSMVADGSSYRLSPTGMGVHEHSLQGQHAPA